jgi:hypothetical protein
MMIVRSAHEELKRWLMEWSKGDKSVVWYLVGFKTDERRSHPQYLQFYNRAQFYFAYHSLVLYSFGLENALEVSCGSFVGWSMR